MESITNKVCQKTFVLDKTKDEEAFANKLVINFRESMFFNILPLK
jgi:ribonucleoside-diphosphate reductase beta chain